MSQGGSRDGENQFERQTHFCLSQRGRAAAVVMADESRLGR